VCRSQVDLDRAKVVAMVITDDGEEVNRAKAVVTTVGGSCRIPPFLLQLV
jgi:lysine/ornithine N-monooxygenase